jgi:serine/threonine protein kinase
MASNSFRIGCQAGTCWLTSRITLMQIGLDLYVSLLLRLSHAYSRNQLSDVASGLCYLHSRNVIHGDLKGVPSCSKSRSSAALTRGQLNILVDDSGHARLADFGFTTVTQNPDSIRSAQSHRCHTVQWAAPEILNEGRHSKEADVFAFAMVMIEVCRWKSAARRALAYCCLGLTQLFTGAIPFRNHTSAMAISAIIQGRRPPRPTHPTFTERLWTLMQRCWDQDPHLRPEVSELLQVLASVSCSSQWLYIR